MQSTNWAPEHSDALREYLGRGMSHSEAAQAINAKFNTAYSRNAVIGRAKRMGLAGADRPERWPKPPPKARQPNLHKQRERHAAAFMRAMPVFGRVETAETPLRRNRAAACFAARPRTRGLPLPLRRRRGGRSHYLLRLTRAARVQATARRISI